MPADKNFSAKLTLSEANTVRAALTALLLQLTAKPVAEMSDADKTNTGNAEKMLRIDF